MVIQFLPWVVGPTVVVLPEMEGGQVVSGRGVQHGAC